jgi:hypothetical protein
MDLVVNDVHILHEKIKYLVGHLVGNDVYTLHEERIHLVGFSFIRVIDINKTLQNKCSYHINLCCALHFSPWSCIYQSLYIL